VVVWSCVRVRHGSESVFAQGLCTMHTGDSKSSGGSNLSCVGTASVCMQVCAEAPGPGCPAGGCHPASTSECPCVHRCTIALVVCLGTGGLPVLASSTQTAIRRHTPCRMTLLLCAMSCCVLPCRAVLWRAVMCQVSDREYLAEFPVWQQQVPRAQGLIQQGKPEEVVFRCVVCCKCVRCARKCCRCCNGKCRERS
jgi:hypothetical protein